jgi:hypothetical protein
MNASLATYTWPAPTIPSLLRHFAWLNRAVGGGQQQMAGECGSQPGGFNDQAPVDPQALFEAAVRASARAHVDWMALYAEMTGPFERLYCLEKALALDPQHQLAREELVRLVSGS